MTKDEAMKQALEALKASRHLLEIEVNKAITRDAADAWIREKEAELRQHDAAITTLRTAIGQAEKQEPVAYIRNDGHDEELIWESEKDDDLAEFYKYEPLYTTPPAGDKK